MSHNHKDELNPERLALSQDGFAHLEKGIQTLPRNQRQILILRDIEGLSSGEVCQLLNMTSNNQQVLLHRARIKIRLVLIPYMNSSL